MKKEFKGQLKGLPEEIVDKMCEYQVEQGNKKDITVFENCIQAKWGDGGFNRTSTKENWAWWDDVMKGDFDLFFKRYPKKE